MHQIESGGAPTAAAITEKATEVANECEQILNSPVFNVNFGQFFEFECKDCRTQIRRRVGSFTPEQGVVCPKCRATYDVESAEGGKVGFDLRKSKYTCRPCGAENWVGTHRVVAGAILECEKCRKKAAIEQSFVLVGASGEREKGSGWASSGLTDTLNRDKLSQEIFPMEDRQDSSAKESANQKLCRYCSMSISLYAKVCHYCNRNQNKYYRLFGGDIGILISILLLVVTFAMFVLARQENIKASQALREAQAAIGKADAAAKNASGAAGQAKRAQCELIRVGFEVVNITNDLIVAAHRVHATFVPQDREMILRKINDLKKHLRTEHGKSECPDTSALKYPTRDILGRVVPE